MTKWISLVAMTAVLAGCSQSPIQKRVAQIKAEKVEERQRILTTGSAEQVAELKLVERLRDRAPDAPGVFWDYLNNAYIPVVIYKRQPTSEMLRLERDLMAACDRWFAAVRDHNARETQAILRGQSSPFGPTGHLDERTGTGAACNAFSPGGLARYATGATIQKSQQVIGDQDDIFQK